ncbi:hypothetical protein ACFO0N_02870 [Halobium salinum]|uniref:Uncharacterized protein n=1 Tax=Halobium salinum TaxID=1364940 RepID=A0ABD5P7M0_9EURY|nr:hypothetical protein [Halobium salinum]
MDQRRVLLAGAVLWALVVGTGVGASAEAVAPGVVSRPAGDVADGAAGALDGATRVVGGSLSFASDDGTVAANVSTDRVSVRAEGDDTAVSVSDLDRSGEGVAVVENDAIDEGVSRSASSGLCAVGLDDPDAPLAVDVDDESGSARVAFSDSRQPTEVGAADAADVLARCTG